MASWCFDFFGLNPDSEINNKYEFFDQETQKFEQAIQNIKNTNRLIAQETIKIIESDTLEIRSLESLGHEEYQHIRADSDPDHREDFLSNLLGIFVYPNKIYISMTQTLSEIERTIVHEIQHYRNSRSGPEDSFDDEMSAREAEDRYSGHYITRKYIRDLRDFINSL